MPFPVKFVLGSISFLFRYKVGSMILIVLGKVLKNPFLSTNGSPFPSTNGSSFPSNEAIVVAMLLERLAPVVS